MKIPASAKVTLWVNRLIALLLVILIFTMPILLRWYSTIRIMGVHVPVVISVAFYCCCIPVAAALWDIEKLMKNILAAVVFHRRNVRLIRRIRWYCLATGVICFPAAFFYPPLIFVSVIMGFLSLVVSVISGVMNTAVEIREENDLTI